MADTQFESDEFLKLLTDALRAGPGSPQWHLVVTQLRNSGGGAEADEYRLICAARERLESGREYGTIRPGPGFTRKVLDGIEERVSAGRRMSLPVLIATVSGLVIVAVVALVLIQVFGSSAPRTAQGELGGLQFVNTVFSTDFAGGIPPEWRTIGQSLVAADGLRAASSNSSDYKGGGIFTVNPIPPTQPLAIETTLRVARATDQVVVQLLVSDDPAFDRTPQATSSHEFVCWFANGQARVAMPDYSVVGQGPRITPDLTSPASVHLSIRLNRRFAVVEWEGQQVYAGPHGLAGDKPRWIGLRFLTRGNESPSVVTVQSLRVMKP